MRFLAAVLFAGALGLAALVALMFLALGEAQGQDLPDAPQPKCQTVEMDAADNIVYRDIDCARLPKGEFARRSRWHALRAVVAPPGFWTVGRYDAPRPLRTARQTLTSKSFLLLELGNWGSAFAMVEVNRNQVQNPPIPRHGDLYVDAYIPAAAVTVLHYAADRYICRAVGVFAVSFATSWRTYSAVKGFYE